MTDGQGPAISRLCHRDPKVAGEIHGLMLDAYRVEAELIKATDFPPLRRTVSQIIASGCRFTGSRDGAQLVAVAEHIERGDRLEVRALVVSPQRFRQGLAVALMRHLLDASAAPTAWVETAAANVPAIALYGSLGFAVIDRYRRPEGIEIVVLSTQWEAQ